MSNLVQIVGQVSGVSTLLSVDSAGRAVVRDADSIAQTTAVNTALGTIDGVLDSSLVQQSAAAASLAAAVVDLASLETLTTAGNASLSSAVVDLAAIEVKQTAIAASLAGTLSVSAPAVSTTNVLLEDATSVADAVTETSPSTDIGNARHICIFGGLDDSSGVIITEVSADNSTFYVNTEQSIYADGVSFFRSMTIDAQYVRFKYTNGSGAAKVWTLNISKKV